MRIAGVALFGCPGCSDPSAMRDHISALFTWTECDFIAAYRAGRMVRDASYDTFVMRSGFLLGGHIALLGGALAISIVALVRGTDGRSLR